MIKRLGLLIISILSLCAHVQGASDFTDRVWRAQDICLRQRNIPKVKLTPIEPGMERQYRPSKVQKFLAPVMSAYADRAGAALQAMLGIHEIAKVDSALEGLGRSLRDFVAKEGLSPQQAGCLSSCMLQRIMDPEEVYPYNSMALAMVEGKGFCRHYVLAAAKILKAARVKHETGVSLTHVFLYLPDDRTGEMRIYDPMNTDGLYQCDYHSKID